MSFVATRFGPTRPSSSNYQLEEINVVLSRCLDDAVGIDVIQFRGQDVEIWCNNSWQKKLKYQGNTP
jgi:hypothetical protein